MVNISRKRSMGIIVLGFFMIITIGCGDNGSNPTSPESEGSATITQPVNGALVGDSILVSGTYKGGVQEDIWVIVWPETAPGVGWPQSDNSAEGYPATKNNGAWYVTCWFGDPLQRYDVAVYTATPQASQALATLLIESYYRGEYLGIFESNLPAGLVERDRIRVEKR